MMISKNLNLTFSDVYSVKMTDEHRPVKTNNAIHPYVYNIQKFLKT